MPPRLMAALILTRKDVLGGLNPEPAPVTIFFTKYEIIVDNLVVGEVARSGEDGVGKGGGEG